MAHNYIKTLKVVGADGLEKLSAHGNVVLQAGMNMEVAKTGDSTIQLSAQTGMGQEDTTVREKFNHVINGGGGFTGWLTEGCPYRYISKINGVTPIEGVAFINVDRCFHVGAFEVPPVPDADATLRILDTCPAAVDCPDYDTMQTYLTTLKEAIDLEKTKIEDPTGVMDKYRQMIERWTYVQHLLSFRCGVVADGDMVYATCKYKNKTDEEIPAGTLITITFSTIPKKGWVYVVDTTTKNSSITAVTASPDGAGSPKPASGLPCVATATAGAIPIDGGVGVYVSYQADGYTAHNFKPQVTFEIAFPVGYGIGDRSKILTANTMYMIPTT